MVAGSHRALIQPAFVRRDLDLPQVELPTATGDVTIHLSCTLHMSHPPVDRERRVLYTDFSPARPRRRPFAGRGQAGPHPQGRAGHGEPAARRRDDRAAGADANLHAR